MPAKTKSTAKPAVNRWAQRLDTAIGLHVRARAWRTRGRLRKAQRACFASLRILRSNRASPPQLVASVHQTLGSLYEGKGQYEDAERSYRRTLRALDEVTGFPHLVDARFAAMLKLANLLRVCARYKEAALLLRNARSLAQRVPGSKARMLSTVQNNLGILYKDTGKYAAAARLYQRALRKLEQDEHPNLLSLAALYHNLGGLEHARGRYARGEPLARRSVILRERALGPKHPAVAADLSALAALLDGQQKYDESEPLYLRAIAIFRRCGDPYELAVNYNNWAAVRLARRDYVTAARLYRYAIRVKKQLFGPSHPGVATTLNNLALVYLEAGRRVEAKSLLRHARRVLNQSLGASHPKTVSCNANYRAVMSGGPRLAGVASL